MKKTSVIVLILMATATIFLAGMYSMRSKESESVEADTVGDAVEEQDVRWQIEPLTNELLRQIEERRRFAYDIHRRGIWLPENGKYNLYQSDGQVLSSLEIPVLEEDKNVYPVLERGTRRFLGFASEDKIWPLSPDKDAEFGEAFDTVRCLWGVYGRHSDVNGQTFFIRFGRDFVRPMGLMRKPPPAGFIIYNQDGEVIMEKSEESGLYFSNVLKDSVFVYKGYFEATAYKIISLDGEVKVSVPRSSIARYVIGRERWEYVGFRGRARDVVSDELAGPTIISIYRYDGERVLYLDSAEETRGILWDIHDHYLIGRENITDYQVRFVIYDLQTGEKKGVTDTINLPAAHSTGGRLRTTPTGELFANLNLRRDREREGEFLYMPFILDVETASIVWKGEPQRFRVGGEETEDYVTIKGMIGRTVPGKDNLLYTYTEEYGPSLIRRIPSPKNQ